MKQKVTVTVNGSTEIVCNKNENLLRVLEKNGFEIEIDYLLAFPVHLAHQTVYQLSRSERFFHAKIFLRKRLHSAMSVLF